MALGRAILDLYGHQGPLAAFMSGPGGGLRILEVNEAGSLTPFLARARGHRLARYPDVDIHALPFAEGSFDLVVHSETLEHVLRPVAALAECRRVLRPGGACAFTIPMVIDRLTASREGMQPSFHNNAEERDPALLVRTEYGADAWRHVVEAGFRECRIVALDSPGAIALVAIRPVGPAAPAAMRDRRSQAAAEAEALKRNWFYRFDLPSGARTESYLPPKVFPIHETREQMVFSVLDPMFADHWEKTTGIDVACHEGFYGSRLAQRGCGSVLGVDARDSNLEGANLMRDALGLKNLSFQLADVSTMDPARFGQFDIVLMLGLIYHLENPVGALRLARALCRKVALIETQLAPELGGEMEWGSRETLKRIAGNYAAIEETDEVTADNREANTTVISLVPSREGLLWTLRAIGFSRVEVVPPPAGAYEQLARGKRVVVAAWV
jgi:tRNA (mo5U34)-methyltransferase